MEEDADLVKGEGEVVVAFSWCGVVCTAGTGGGAKVAGEVQVGEAC
jgi:hypothetical protein